MRLTSGTRLGPYEILAPIGAGGMGEVYKARDTRLDRTVAVKVSSEHFSERFEREARAVAALNHANICTLHDVGPDYLVMEYIEGTPLMGPLPLGQALKYGAQICDALDAAHRKGIVHRDLKPANILVTKSGIKLLDFGLAKMGLPAGAPGDATVTMALTGKNEIVGTLYYMSPEQLQAQGTGQEIDARSDIFSFGLVLYEMLTGKRAFEGASAASVIAAIMERPAPSLLGMAPPAMDHVLQRCLAKDADERWQSARDLRAELEWIANAAATVSGGAVTARSPRLQWIAVGVLAVVAAGMSWMVWRGARAAPDRPMVQVDLDAGPDGVTDPVISPDGSRVAFIAQAANGSHLAMRRLDQTRINALADTEGARFPFFSPDGRSLGFFEIRKMEAGGRLKVLSLDGGAATALADADYPGGASWSDGGTIAATLNQWATGIVHRIPVTGGSPQPLTLRDLGSEHVSPQYLPGGKALLFTRKRLVGGFTYEVCAATPGMGKTKVLVANASGARYLESGHLVFFRQGRIYAARFHPGRLELTGEAIPMVEGVSDRDGISPFSVSSTGDLVYLKGRAPQRIVVGIDATGAERKIIATAGVYVTPRISPDGKRLAIVDLGVGDGRILIHDFVRGVTNRLTLDDRPQRRPVWTADGRQVVYFSGETMLSARADGAGQPEVMAPGRKAFEVTFSRDGKLAAFSGARSGGDGYEIWISRIENRGGKLGFGEPMLLGGGARTQNEPVLSPDGRWLAYMSNETGVYQVYVVSLTADGRPAGGKWQVSGSTGYNPSWPAAGGQIFFEGHQSGFYVASYSAKGDSFASEPPRPWAQRRSSFYEGSMSDSTPDGKQLIAVVDAEGSARETHIRMILHFGDEIRRRLAGGAK